MAVYPVVDNPKKFLGLSTDTKPTGLVGAGHKFVETDTGKRWVWIGASWVEDLEHTYYKAAV